MRWLRVLLVPGLFVIALVITARRAGSHPNGSDIWKVRLDTSSSDHWILLDTGSVLVDGHPTFACLLAHHEEDAPAHRYDAMKVQAGRGELPLWTYDGTGSDYVDGRSPGPGNAGDDEAGMCFTPRLRDVDGDGSDDVVFVEQDFVFGRLLRAVRIEP